MEVIQEQYKDTKVGRIPKDWEVVKLEEVLADFQNGYAFSSKGYVKEGIPIVSMAYIGLKGQFSFNYEKANYWSSESKIELSRYLLHKGDLLIAMTDVTPTKNLIGRMVLIDIDDEFLLNQRVGLIKTNDRIYKQFLMYLGNSKVWRDYSIGYSTLGVQTNLGTKEIRKGRIPLPSLPEQQKIAEILATVDEQISITQSIIEKSKELKKGLMKRFFLNKAYMIMSLGKVEKTELMPIRFNQLGKILTGTTPPTAKQEYYDSKDYMFIGPADMGKIRDIKNSNKYISQKGFEVARKLPTDAIMVVCIGATIGKIGLTIEPCATNQQVNTIVPKEEYSATYLYYLISGLKKYLLGFAGDTATPQLNKTDFGKVVTFIHKTKSEREKIAEVLSEADAKIEKEEQEKAQLEQLKKGLMQQLLTGQKRVKV
jgi:type I restriction enzyme, S subunit